MNYKRAAVATGASFVALLIMSAAAVFCFAATFELSFPGSGPSDGERLLWFTVLPTATGVGGALVAWGFGGGRWRVATSTVIACALSAVWVSVGPAASIPNATSGEEGISVQSALLWISALYAVIATVRRPEVAPRRAAIVYALSAVSSVFGLLLINADFGGPSTLAALAVWVLLPALAGLAMPPPGRPREQAS